MKIYPHSLLNGRCRYCLKPLVWALTFPNRNKVPLDFPIHGQELEFDADGHEIQTLTSPTHFDTCTEYDPKKRAGEKSHHVKPILQGKLFE